MLCAHDHRRAAACCYLIHQCVYLIVTFPRKVFQLHKKKKKIQESAWRRRSQLLRCHGAVEGVWLLLLPFDGCVSGKKHFLPEGLPGLLTRTLTPTVTTLYSPPDQHTQATLAGCRGTRTREFLVYLFYFSLRCGCRYKIIYGEMLADGFKSRLTAVHKHKEK